MGYQPNVVNKGDIIVLNNIKFTVVNDFNLQQKSKVLKLVLGDNEPNTYIADIKKRDSHNGY